MKSVEQWAADNRAERSRQEKIDRVMCRPGYTWNETLGKCLPPVGYGESGPKTPQKPPAKPEIPAVNPGKPVSSPDAKIAAEGYARASQGLSK